MSGTGFKATLQLVLALVFCVWRASGIGCFVCSSIKHSEPDCEDNFNNTNRFYSSNCFAPRPKRGGLFPATHCVKFKGTIIDSGATYMVRACVVDNGDVNTETEIARSNHCGILNEMIFDDLDMKGCVLSCDSDGCNEASRPEVTWPHAICLALTALYSLYHTNVT